jgi:hypothetical protein
MEELRTELMRDGLPQLFRYGDRAAIRGVVPDRILNHRNRVNFWTPTGSWIMNGILGRLYRGRYEGRMHNGPGLGALVSQATENAAGGTES